MSTYRFGGIPKVTFKQTEDDYRKTGMIRINIALREQEAEAFLNFMRDNQIEHRLVAAHLLITGGITSWPKWGITVKLQQLVLNEFRAWLMNEFVVFMKRMQETLNESKKDLSQRLLTMRETPE